MLTNRLYILNLELITLKNLQRYEKIFSYIQKNAEK